MISKSCEQRATVSKLFTLAPNLERIECDAATYHGLLLKAISANQLPRLNYIDRPISPIEIRDYVACCLLLKDRLKTLWIVKEDSEAEAGVDIDDDVDDEDDEDDSKSTENNEQIQAVFQTLGPFRPCAGLLQCLNQFKSLEKVHIFGIKISIISLTHYILCQSPSLRKLSLQYTSENNTNIDELSDRSHDLSELTFYGDGVNNEQIVEHVVLNFPKLEKVDLTLRCRRLKDTTYAKLLDYLWKMKEARVCNILWGEQAMAR